MLPKKQRVRIALNSIANAVQKANPQMQVAVQQAGEYYAYFARTCSVCYGRHSDRPVCYLYVGSIGEAVHWATGQTYKVEETHCVAKGDPFCRFEVMESD